MGAMQNRKVSRLWAGIGLAICLACSGCGALGAPSFAVVGTFFPAWMFCAAIGIAAAIVARLAFVAKGLNRVLPYQLLLCTAIGVIVGVVFWIALFAL
jgi:hypothetical protein